QTTFFKKTKILDFVIFGIFSLMFLIGFYFIPNWIPSFGVSMEFPGLSILIFGILLLLITYIRSEERRVGKDWWSLFGQDVQAEDGIRDRNVTGVQTCALPI